MRPSVNLKPVPVNRSRVNGFVTISPKTAHLQFNIMLYSSALSTGYTDDLQSIRPTVISAQ